MINNAEGRAFGPAKESGLTRALIATFFVFITICFAVLPQETRAQSYQFSSVSIEGNQRVEAGTILSYAGIARGQSVSGGDLNEAYQRIEGSGLFETVELVPQGSTLVIRVAENPTINRISIEGNQRIKDEVLEGIIQSQPRRVFSAAQAERDAAEMVTAYSQQGRITARVTPQVIRRSDNRVDLVFEVFEGGVVEVERIGFVGNQKYSDGRLRRVLQTKQAGIFRLLVKSDTLIEDRIEFDKQVLADFYSSRGYVDFRTTGVNAELTRKQDGYFVTFNVQEGQQFRFGQITTSSDLAEVDVDLFQDALKIRPGVVYSPSLVDNSIARLERLAIREGLNFVRVEPRVTRNDRDLTLDVEFVLSRGPRIFVERIDIEGNTTTLDRVIRRQFKVVEGDPFNPREIRESASRIRALGFFTNAEVDAREGSSPDQVVVDVNVEEQPTGSLSFGGSYSTDDGFGIAIQFRERNFLGRGQSLSLGATTASSDREYNFNFGEPAFLGRDLAFNFDASYAQSDDDDADYDTQTGKISPSFTFPVSENGRLSLRYTLESTEISDVDEEEVGDIVQAEEDQGQVWKNSIGYTYSYDTRRTGLNPNAGILLEFGQDLGKTSEDATYVKTNVRAIAQTKVMNEDVTLRATLRGGALNFSDSSSRVTDRFFLGSSIMRGFEYGGIGPREVGTNSSGNDVDDALGGNLYAVASFEAEFPLGLPEEYGISGGVFYDVGSLWSLDETNSNTLYTDFSARHVVGVSVFWTTPIGPLRFNFTKALVKEDYDNEQNFDLTISTQF